MKKQLDSMSGDISVVADDLARIADSLERMVSLFEGLGRAGRALIEPMALVGRMIQGNRAA